MLHGFSLPPATLVRMLIGRLEHTGLTPKTWLGAPADVMEQTLDYIQRRFGSTEAYMHGVGFKEADMSALHDALAL